MTAKKAILAVSALALVAACSHADGQLDRRRTGALAGGVIGGLVGAANGGNNSTPEVLIGAGLGALAGGAIGGVLDRQAGELRQSLGPDVGVVNTGNEIVVTMPQDILFATDSAALRPDLQSDLRTIAANLQRYPDSVVVVTGHTDSTGTAAHNQALSERRADAVAGVLISSGVPARRIQAVGAGQTQPIASNGSASGRAQNRRVEITIRPTN